MSVKIDAGGSKAFRARHCGKSALERVSQRTILKSVFRSEVKVGLLQTT